MKKILFGTAVFIAALCCVNINAVAQVKPSELSAIVGASAWTNDQFSTFGGSLVLGPQVVLDHEKDLYARLLYHRINVGTPTLQSLDLGIIGYWYLGNKWSFYVGPGFNVGLSEGTGNNLTFGAGVEYPLMIVNDPTYIVPFSIHAYGEVSSTDEASQITIGLRFAKPQK